MTPDLLQIKRDLVNHSQKAQEIVWVKGEPNDHDLDESKALTVNQVCIWNDAYVSSEAHMAF